MPSREDALRHLCAFQCTRCGETFGKSYALKRHTILTKRCLKSPNKHEQINPELSTAIEKLQNAKGENIYPAIKLCIKYLSTSGSLRTTKRGSRNLHAESRWHHEEVYQDGAAILSDSDAIQNSKYGTTESMSQVLFGVIL